VCEAAALGEGDELFHIRAQLAGLRQGGGDLLVLDEGGGHVLEQGGAVCGSTAQFTAGNAVAHWSLSVCSRGRMRYPGPGPAGSCPFSVSDVPRMERPAGLRWPCPVFLCLTP